MKPLSRRHFCVSATFAPFFAAPFVERAYVAAPPSKNQSDLPVETLAAQGTRMVREGRTFEKAAERFALAAQKEPTNAAHQTALGCALASRAVTIAYAAAFARNLAWERAEYPNTVRQWEAGRADWEIEKAENPNGVGYKNRTYDDTKPKLPPARDFVTKDDQAPFRLTPEETSARLSELCQQARQAWDKSIVLSKTREEKADAFYVQAWGLKILSDTLASWETDNPNSLLGWDSAPWDNAPGNSSYGGEDGLASRPMKKKPLPFAPTKKDAVRAAKEAATFAPENALVAQMLGDVLWNIDKPQAIVSYEKALALAPKNPNLLYQLYQEAVEKDLRAFKEKQNPAPLQKGASPVAPAVSEPFAASLSYLRRAQSRDRANAWGFYEEAGIYFRLAPYNATGPSVELDATPAQKQAALDAVANKAARQKGRKAVDLIVTGNALPRCTLPVYEENVPKLLQQAWGVNALRLMTTLFGSLPRLRELARSATGYGQIVVERENNAVEALRANRATIGMGLRIVADWPSDDKIKNGKTIIEVLLGVAVCTIGYKGLIQTCTTAGDVNETEAAQKEYDAFQIRYTAYRKEVAAHDAGLFDNRFPYSAY